MGTTNEDQQGLGARNSKPEVAIGGSGYQSQKRPRVVKEGQWSRAVATDNLSAEYVCLWKRGNKYTLQIACQFLPVSKLNMKPEKRVYSSFKN